MLESRYICSSSEQQSHLYPRQYLQGYPQFMSNFKQYIRKKGCCCHINSRLFEEAVEDLNRIDLIGFKSRTNLRVKTLEGYFMPQNYL